MAKNTSILLGDYFDSFIKKQIQTGKFSFEHSEIKKTELVNELKKGEKSGFIEHFDRQGLLDNLHQQHAANNEV